MTTALIIIFCVVGIVGGSIFWVLPSPEERRRMRLRQQALAAGFRVRQTTPEKLDDALKNLEANAWRTHFYFKAIPASRTPRRALYASQGGELKQQSISGNFPHDLLSDDDLRELSSQVKAVQITGHEVGFLWEERGTPEELGQVLQRINKLVVAAGGR
ncbi:hypothetical protein HCH_04759 [Hahella chejuensis KCTC 2396]|uniref:Uncharacterized protein n=1 Tax=Hahella chejuensis (strain KCTC 2396) TaxID=349521 RepID=Q2SD20_HAHCH|nr:hypothetical protein [Hahella chejuensis]ABC31454.1 hypothetical protein HCH_04759 [Hahella chejuensis KCTC 2396]